MAIAALLVISGVFALINYGARDPFLSLLPEWEAHVLSAVSITSGLALIAGSGVPHKGSECAGLLLLIAVIMSRFLLTGQYLGYGSDFIVTGVFDSAIVWAASARLFAIVRNRRIVVVGDVE
jgi:hypothetical protein